jgi:hypothetical protein
VIFFHIGTFLSEGTTLPFTLAVTCNNWPASPEFDSDRVPEMDENWTFGVYSSLYAKGGAQDRFILDSTFLNQNLLLKLY